MTNHWSTQHILRRNEVNAKVIEWPISHSIAKSTFGSIGNNNKWLRYLVLWLIRYFKRNFALFFRNNCWKMNKKRILWFWMSSISTWINVIRMTIVILFTWVRFWPKEIFHVPTFKHDWKYLFSTTATIEKLVNFSFWGNRGELKKVFWTMTTLENRMKKKKKEKTGNSTTVTISSTQHNKKKTTSTNELTFDATIWHKFNNERSITAFLLSHFELLESKNFWEVLTLVIAFYFVCFLSAVPKKRNNKVQSTARFHKLSYATCGV